MSRRGNWKDVERAIAGKFGEKRIPVTGRTRGEVADTTSKIFAQEIKNRKEIPLWIEDAMDQAIQASVKNGGFPMVVLHKRYQRYDDSYVIMRLKDFQEYSGLIPKELVDPKGRKVDE